MKNHLRKNHWALVAAWLLLACAGWGQSNEKIKTVLDRALEAMGGPAFLQVKDYSAVGRFYALKEDVEGWAEFSDQTRLPGKTRQQTGKKGDAEVTLYDLDAGKGWFVYGGTEIKPAKPEQMERFKKGARRDYNNLFRSRLQETGFSIHYYGSDILDGRRPVQILEMIDAENDTILAYFDDNTGLPFRLEYQDTLPNGRRVRVWDEFYNWHVIEGVNTPMRQDRLHNGQPASQVFLTGIRYNVGLADSLFAEPVPPPPKKKK